MQKRDTILIVDDIELNRTILGGLFQEEYHLLEAENGEQALLLLRQYHSSIAMILLDIVMPVMDGYQVLEEIRSNGLLLEVPVVVITADNSLEGELRAFDLGASDIIVKPFEPHVVKRRVHNIVELYLHKHNLEGMVEEQAAKLRESNEMLVDALSSVIEYRSLESGQHIRRIRLLCRTLLEEVRQNCPEYNLDHSQINTIASASAMHDIGKIAIPDSILNKPGKLTPKEFAVMKTHTAKGCEILSGLNRMSDREYLRYAYNICRYHHERWDGGGYPDQLKGDAIPICAQVVGIVDAYDALTSDRVYKKAISHERAVNMIINGECGAFSPKLLECFKSIQMQLAALVKKYADGIAPFEQKISDPALMSPPSLQDGALSLMQTEQMKYYAMLRFENATVAEIDLATGNCHLVYLPSALARSFYRGEPLEEAVHRYVLEIVHPDDRAVIEKVWSEGLPLMFELGLFQQSWRHRIFDSISNTWRNCTLTALRIVTERPHQRKAMLIWRTEEKAAVKTDAARLDDATVLHRILGGIFCCKNDKWLSILDADDGFLGHSKKTLETVYHNRFLNLIHPDDQERVSKQLIDQLNFSVSYELECRVKAGRRYVWILCKGQCLHEANGEETLYNVVIDIDQSKHIQEELRLSLERYRIIFEQTNDIIFEWDIRTDTVVYSANWKEKFGYDPINVKASQRIPQVSHLHPEDMPAFGRFIEEMGGGRRYSELDFRLADKQGLYLWCRIRATAQFDDQGVPYRVVGTVVDINDEKIAAQELRAQAERDTLTKLYNKTSSRQRIESYLSERAADELCALYIIDLDNFKLINDRFGHLFGDAVLTKVAALLGRLFPSENIVARIGGDEFMVLMPGVQNEARVHATAERIIMGFMQAFFELPQECSILCSVGISFCPKDGNDFQTLFQRADMALYRAKAMGKKCYQIYDPALALDLPANRPETISTRIDSDDRPDFGPSDMIPVVFRTLNEADDLDRAIGRVLEMVGRHFGVSRCYIFESSEDNLFCNNTFEWCRDGVLSQRTSLQNISYAELSVHYSSLFNEKGVFYCSDLSRLPQDLRGILEPQNIQSMLQCAIRDAGVFRGWVGFDDCDSQVFWTQDQIDLLSFVADLLSLFLLKRRAQERVAGMSRDLMGILDHQNSWIYVVDPDTYELLYINEKTRHLVPEAGVGMLCHKAFMNKHAPCEVCPMKNIRQRINCNIEIFNENLGVWTSADAALIRWEQREACMLTCHDVTHYKLEKIGGFQVPQQGE